MNQFSDFGLPSFIIESLDRMKITEPTPIQRQSIPFALKGKDILGTAQTGTGKTIAYLLPVLSQLSDCAHGTALILAPTRELADQIKNALLLLIGKRDHRDIALLIGGAPIYKQFIALKKHPRFIIGTPGRIIDHLERGSLSLAHTKFLILDETDRMLDMGFSDDLETIVKALPKERQTMMFSATMPANIVKLSHKYLSEPEHIRIGEVTKAAAKIEQKTLKANANEKFPLLLKELNEREGSVIIFVRTKISAAQLADKLRREDHRADAIHGDLRQRQRDEVIRNYRNQKNRILVATDIAARGLDIPHIMHVINFDLPQCPEDYIHRIGRTGRAGMQGFALSFVGPAENRKWQSIYQHVNHGKTSEQPSRRPFGKGRRPNSSSGNKPYDRTFRQGRPKDNSSSENRSEGRRSEGWRSEERRSEGRGSEERRSEGRPSEGRRSEGRPSEGRRSEGRRSEGRSSEGRPSEGRRSEGRPSEGRRSEGRRSEGRPSEGRASEGRRSEGRSSEGRASEGRRSEGKRPPRRKDAQDGPRKEHQQAHQL